MRLGTFVTKAGQHPAAAFVSESRLMDLGQAYKQLRLRKVQRAGIDKEHWLNPADIRNWITPTGMDLAYEIQSDSHRFSNCLHDSAALSIGPPIPEPRKFIAIGRNYLQHFKEGQRIWPTSGVKIEIPTSPAAFVKFTSCITAHNTPIILPTGVENIDYEVELAVVIGRPAFRVSTASALDYVAGYTICNDVGARKIQRLEMKQQIGLTLSKNLRSFAPTGPWLVTRDETPTPQNLSISLFINGQQRQVGQHIRHDFFGCRNRRVLVADRARAWRLDLNRYTVWSRACADRSRKLLPSVWRRRASAYQWDR